MTTQIKAWGAVSPDEPIRQMSIERRPLGVRDVAFEVLYCGICHSDLHTIRNDWGSASYPVVAGHEIVGRVTAVGSEVSRYSVGDLVALGCIVDSCRSCSACHEGIEQYCTEGVTYSFNDVERDSGRVIHGGFSELYVCHEDYVLRMPPFADLACAAPLLCAGITVYSPLKHWGATGRHVGIVGIGGLGHLAIQIAKAMGAEVSVLTTSESKVADALRLGADRAVLSSDRSQMKALPQLDLIIDTVSARHAVNPLLSKLKLDGTLVLVGLPAEPLEVGAFHLIARRHSLAGSSIGGIKETEEMLEFCYEHGITAECELISPDQINEAMERLERNDVRYRFVIDMGR